jgi:hypothetical protein
MWFFGQTFPISVYQDLPKIVGLEQFELAPWAVGGAKIGGTAGPIEPNDRRADFGHRAGREDTDPMCCGWMTYPGVRQPGLLDLDRPALFERLIEREGTECKHYPVCSLTAP